MEQFFPHLKAWKQLHQEESSISDDFYLCEELAQGYSSPKGLSLSPLEEKGFTAQLTIDLSPEELQKIPALNLFLLVKQ